MLLGRQATKIQANESPCRGKGDKLMTSGNDVTIITRLMNGTAGLLNHLDAETSRRERRPKTQTDRRKFRIFRVEE